MLREQRCAPWIAPFAEALPIQGYSKPKCNEAPAIDLLPFQVDSHVFVRLGCSRFRRVPCPGLLAFHVCSSPDPKNQFRNVRFSCLEKLKRITSVWNHTIWFRFCFLCLRLANPIQVADFRCSWGSLISVRDRQLPPGFRTSFSIVNSLQQTMW